MPLDTENWTSPTMGHSFGVPVPSPVLGSAFYLGQHQSGNDNSTDFGQTIVFGKIPHSIWMLAMELVNRIEFPNQ